MGRLTWLQLRFRTGRTVALLAGMLVATTAFTLLTAAARTSQLRTIGTLAAHSRSAYQILVRPRGARTSLESSTGTVQPNFLSGIYGGITLGQYRQIEQIPGVAVAAPIAMVGYSFPTGGLFPVRLPGGAGRSGRRLYRVTTTWVSANGASRVNQPPSYVYVTSNRLTVNNNDGTTSEVLPGGRRVAVCPTTTRASSPFSAAAQSQTYCWSRQGSGGFAGLSARHPGFLVNWSFPMLVAAVDPVAEARLDGLNRSVISGRYLGEHAGPRTSVGPSGLRYTTFPVLAANQSGVGEYSLTRVQRLPDPAAPVHLNLAGMLRDAATPGQTVMVTRITADQVYQRLLTAMTDKFDYSAIFQYWTAGPTRYRPGPGGSLVPIAVRNPLSVWRSAWGGNTGFAPASMDNADAQYRALHVHASSPELAPSESFPLPRLVGRFDPARVEAFDPLTRVPLGPFQPTAASPADAASRKALGGRDLLPNLNLGGYVSQPPQLITTLSALPELDANPAFSANTDAKDPISVIRVRVADARGLGALAQERVKEVAQQIATRTHLDVDIVAGSSPAPTLIDLPAGAFGQPALRLTEPWVKKGVTVAILLAVDKKSVLLFMLILVVCGLFVANSATSAVRGRRRELGVLACLGWTRPRLFGTVLSELALLGLAAGILGGAASLALSVPLHLHASLTHAALAVPAAVALAAAAGAIPAWLASRAEPVEAVRPPVLLVRRGYQPTTIAGLALVNVLRSAGRAAIGALTLATGIAAMTMLTAVTLAFHGVVVGSLLGDVVAIQARGVDYVAVTAIVALGVLSVTDVLFLNIRERAAELATIHTFGWSSLTLRRLVAIEGAIIGAAGAIAGAATGLAAAAGFTGQLSAGLLTVAAAAAVAGAVVATLGALAPAQLQNRLPTVWMLGEE